MKPWYQGFVSNFKKQILISYDNFNFPFFFNFSWETELDFINFHFAFSISFYSPYSHLDSLHSHPDSHHSNPDSSHSESDSHHSHHDSPHPHPNSLHSHPDSWHLIIPFIPFPDSPFRLLQIAKFKYSFWNLVRSMMLTVNKWNNVV